MTDLEVHKNQPFRYRLRFAVNGLLHGLRTERSVQSHAWAFLAVFLILLLVRPPPVWWALVIFGGCAVIAAELLNTALERLADHLHPDRHPEIRIVKDCAAGAVLLIALGTVAIGVALLVQWYRQLDGP